MFVCTAVRRLALLVCIASLTACAGSRYEHRHDSAPPVSRDVSAIPDAVPRVEPRSRYGNPKRYTVNGRTYRVMDDATGYVERGIASWYGRKFHGHRTSSGETYDMYAMTAAHTRLPLPTYVEVTNLRNGRKVVVRVNDRGPFHPNRLIDLSWAAAKKLGIVETGTGLVEVRAIDPRTWRRASARASAPASRVSLRYGLYLQVGAFSSRTNAENLQRQLRQFGPVAIQTVGRKRNRLYRVRIGPLSSVEAADRLAERLIRHGFDAPHVVID